MRLNRMGNEREGGDPALAVEGCGCGEDDLRCGCGRLLGRLVPGGVELKCHRCKRTFVLPIEEEAAPA